MADLQTVGSPHADRQSVVRTSVQLYREARTMVSEYSATVAQYISTRSLASRHGSHPAASAADGACSSSTHIDQRTASHQPANRFYHHG